jgi:hypothetical protein
MVYSVPGSESQVMRCENPVGGGDFITRVKAICIKCNPNSKTTSFRIDFIVLESGKIQCTIMRREEEWLKVKTTAGTPYFQNHRK